MIDPLVIAGVLRDLHPPMIALGLGAARLYGLLIVMPLFTRMGLTGLLRGGVALGLAVPLLPLLTPLVASAPPAGFTSLTLLLMKELAIGLAIGALFSVPFWAAEVAGEIIDQQRGSQAAVVLDATATNQTGITGTLLSLTLITLFLIAGGMRFMIDAVFDSYRIWGALDPTPHFAPGSGDRLLGLLDQLLRGGFLLAAPLLIAMLLGEIALGLISRFAPQINVFDIALSVKGLITVVGLPVYAVFLITYLRDGLAPLASISEQLRLFAG